MQIFSLKPGRPVWQEVRDQVGHCFYAVCLMTAFVFTVTPWLAFLLVMVVAFERELEQHSWDWREVGRQDLFFWAVASGLFAGVYYLV